MGVSGYRVFILGSGFSASMGLPTLRNLFAEMMAHPERSGERDKEEILNGLQFLYPHFRAGLSPPSYPPFEEFLTLVTAADDLPHFEEGYWDIKRRCTLRLLTDYLANRSEEGENSPLLKTFVGSLKHGDVIITFNWDNLIERALFLQSRNPDFQSRSSNAITVLKLHGSLNWGILPEGTSHKHPESVLWLTDRVMSTPDYRYFDLWDVLDEPPLIIPPIYSKRVPTGDFLRGIWQEAFISIIEAERVAFIGYSIPKDDLQARTLLVSAWTARMRKREADSQSMDKYILIDPNPEICGTYFSEISGDILYYQSHFSEKLFPILFEKERDHG